jgi:DNA-binding MarR family transcriptional regulator
MWMTEPIMPSAGADGLPTLAIRDRMIDEGSTVTRLLDKLEQAGLVTRDRSRPDRRQVLCQITSAGEALLTTLDPDVDTYYTMDAVTVKSPLLIETLSKVVDTGTAIGVAG